MLQVENCDSTHYVEVYYELDRSGTWRLLGTANDAATVHTLTFSAPDFTSLTVGSGSTTTTVELLAGSTTTNVSVGDCVRIDGEVRVVAGVTDSNTFTLERPLTTAPSSGDTVYASLPCSVEIRLMLRLVSSADETESVKVMNVACYCEANVRDRWAVTLQVRVEDGLRCLNESPYPYSAAALSTELEKWVTRKTAFTLHDLRGTERTVKVANATEMRAQRKHTDTGDMYATVMNLNLIEVDVETV